MRKLALYFRTGPNLLGSNLEFDSTCQRTLEAQSASAGKVIQNNWVLGRLVVSAQLVLNLTLRKNEESK